MLIEQLSDICVKFTLSDLELNQYNLDFNSIGKYDNSTRAMILNLMQLAENKPDIDIFFGSSEVYVEAFSCSNGNCIIYISLIEKQYEKNNFFMCKTDNLNHLIRISKQLIKFSNKDISSSTLYLHNDIFILMIFCTKKSFERILYCITEFCEYSNKHPTNIENWHCLAQENALQRLNSLQT